MSTAIWDEGNVLASLACRRCCRCTDGKLKRCIHLWCNGHELDLCFECFTDLSVTTLTVLFDEAWRP